MLFAFYPARRPKMQEDSRWIIEETKAANFGDKRLNKRYGDLLNSFASTPTKSIPASCKSWGETLAAYRFLNHDNVTETEILAPHKTATLERIKKEKIVLIPQDTTEIDFTGRKSLSGIGYLTQESGQGFYLHPSVAYTPEKCCLGVIDLQTWTRTTIGKRGQRKNKPIEEKESYCWLKGYEAANEIALSSPTTMIVSISDREGDIYDVLEKLPSEENKAYWLIRSQHNRSILNEASQKFDSQLRKSVGLSEPIGKMEFKMPAGISYRNTKRRHARTERLVRQEVRVCTVWLRPPRSKLKKFESIPINVVHCKEIDPPSGEEAVEWFLLTSIPIQDVETAMEVVNWYLCRWLIETFFKVLKSGCLVEELQFETLKGTINCIAFYMIVSWRIIYLTMLGRSCPEMDCSVVFETSEWQAVYAIVKKQSPPKKPPTLNEIILMIAKLGGFLGRKSDGYPGPQVMWIGIQRMRDFTLAWETFHSMGGE
jgi:hypothetical protein